MYTVHATGRLFVKQIRQEQISNCWFWILPYTPAQKGLLWTKFIQIIINSESLEDMQVGYILQKYTLDNYTLEKYTLAQKTLVMVATSLVMVATSLILLETRFGSDKYRQWQMTRSVGEIDNICKKYSYKIDKSHGATYMRVTSVKSSSSSSSSSSVSSIARATSVQSSIGIITHQGHISQVG